MVKLTVIFPNNSNLPKYKVIHAPIESPYRVVTKYAALENYCFVYLTKKSKDLLK